MHPFAPRRHRTGQGRHLHDHGLADEQHLYRACAHALASQYCSAGFLAVMTVLLPFSWLTLLYASEALGLAFVAYTIENSPGARVVYFDCTSPKLDSLSLGSFSQ
jgi:hypothetical protein